MPTYKYKAAMSTGAIVTNRVDAESKSLLIRMLKVNGLTPIEIHVVEKRKINVTATKKKKNIDDIDEFLKGVNTGRLNSRDTKSVFEKFSNELNKSAKITTRDIIIFTQNFYLLKKSSFNNIHALKTILEGTENFAFQDVIEDILAGVEAGENIYTTMEYYSDIFPYIYINMIKVGELSGSLEQSLEQAVRYLEESSAFTKKIRGIIIPNVVQFILLLVMLLAGTLFAIPAIQGVFDEMGTEETLPAVTIWFAGVVDFWLIYWYVPVIIIGVIIGMIYAYIQTPRGKFAFDNFKYKMPVFGSLIYAIDFSRLMKSMLLNLQNGLRIQDSLEVSKNVIQNYVMLAMIETSLNNMLLGTSWLDPFEESGLSNKMSMEMLKIGMQTDLTEMMEKLVMYIEMDIDVIMERIMKVLPEIAYSMVGIVLIFFVLVVLVPCIEVYMGNFIFSAYGF